jgi:hypothetical protein
MRRRRKSSIAGRLRAALDQLFAAPPPPRLGPAPFVRIPLPVFLATGRFNDPPWIPISDPVDLKHLGKLGEELNECGAATSRCIIQGLDGLEPVTGKPNRLWLQDEIADVLANAELVIARFGLDQRAIDDRKALKLAKLSTWHSEAANG